MNKKRKAEFKKEYAELECEVEKKITGGKGFYKRVRNKTTFDFITYHATGFEVLTDYQFRFGDIDFWTSGKWYNRITKEKGEVYHVVDFLVKIKAL